MVRSSVGFKLLEYQHLSSYSVFKLQKCFISFCFQIYVACSIHLFSLAKFWPSYDQLARIPSLPYLIPIAQIGLMGSVYCTVALAVERFLAVCYPFLPRK